MDTRLETVHIAVEDIRLGSSWTRLLAELPVPDRAAALRFVAYVDGYVVATSPAFAAPRRFDWSSPRGAWVRDMRECLDELCGELERDGWLWTGAGPVPWDLTYERLS